MTRSARRIRRLASAWLNAALGALCVVAPAGPIGADTAAGAVEAGGRCQSEAPFELNLGNRTMAQSIRPELASQSKRKFVAIEISDVHNPGRIRISFDVYHRPNDQEQTLLGTFGLFPPDEPGRFIVATKGVTERIGEIVVSMNVLDEVTSTDEVRVTIKRIYFTDD